MNADTTVDLSLQGRATARVQILTDRVNVLTAIAAMSRVERLEILYETARSGRATLDASTSARNADLTRAVVTAEQALAHATSAGGAHPEAVQTAEAATLEINRLKAELDAGIQNRVQVLGEASDQIDQLIEERRQASRDVVEALEALGKKRADLNALIEVLGGHEAHELIECASRHTRAARSAFLLDVMRAELATAQGQLARVGSSEDYDQAFETYLDAEHEYAIARRVEASSARNSERTLRVMLRAAHQLSTLTGDAKGSAPSGSEPGAHPDAPAQGQGASVAADTARDSRSDVVTRVTFESAPEVAQS